MRIILAAISLIALLATPLFAHEPVETLPQIQKTGKIRINP